MPMLIALAAIPRQETIFTADKRVWSIRVYQVSDTKVAIDVAIDGTEIITGRLVGANSPVLPYDYLAARYGNLSFFTTSGADPNWQQFGTPDCQLIYASAQEIAENV